MLTVVWNFLQESIRPQELEILFNKNNNNNNNNKVSTIYIKTYSGDFSFFYYYYYYFCWIEFRVPVIRLRVSKSGNIHDWLLKLIKKPFSINHWLKRIFRQTAACFLTIIICFPVKHMFVKFSCVTYCSTWQCTCICIFVWPVLSNLKYGSKIGFLNDKKQVFTLKFYWSDIWIIIDYVKYNRSS